MSYNLVIHDKTKEAEVLDYLRSLGYVTVSEEIPAEDVGDEDDFEVPEWQKELVLAELKKEAEGKAEFRPWDEVYQELLARYVR